MFQRNVYIIIDMQKLKYVMMSKFVTKPNNHVQTLVVSVWFQKAFNNSASHFFTQNFAYYFRVTHVYFGETRQDS